MNKSPLIRNFGTENNYRIGILFLFWPIIALILSLKNYRTNWSKNVFWMFCVFFGLTFVISTFGGDSERYALDLYRYASYDFKLKHLLDRLYTGGSLDIFQPIITFLVAKVTQSPKILMGVFGIFFGYFYSRNLWFIFENVNGKISKQLIIFIATFALINPIWNINGFRWYTAAHVFLFGVLPYIVLQDKSKLLLSLVMSVLIHFSFFYMVLIFALYYFCGNRIHIYFWLFILSSFVIELDLSFIRNSLQSLPMIFHERIDSYTNEDYALGVSERLQNVNWYIKYYQKVLSWIVYAFAIFIYSTERVNLKSDNNLYRLFTFSLLVYSAANISSNMPSGGRFITVANLFIFAFIILFISKNYSLKSKVYNAIKYFSVPLASVFIIVSIRKAFDYLSFITIFGNPLLAFLDNDSIALIEFIKQLL